MDNVQFSATFIPGGSDDFSQTVPHVDVVSPIPQRYAKLVAVECSTKSTTDRCPTFPQTVKAM